jgi:Flp pilus assembly protein TadG
MRIFRRDQSAQALLELAFLLPILCVMMLGVVDYSRAIYDTQVITNLAGEGADLASRGSSLQNAAAAVMADADLNMASNGCAIITATTYSSSTHTYSVTQQAYSATCNGGTSQIGCAPPTQGCGTASNLPTGVQNTLSTAPSGYVVYITEVYYNFSAATGLGSFLHGSGLLPSRMYAIAYY